LGVDLVPIDKLSFKEQRELFRSCGTIISCGAEHFGKMIFSHPQCRFLELAGPGHMTCNADHFATAAGLGSYTREFLSLEDYSHRSARAILQKLERYLSAQP
jgi:hypothetical protein